MVAETGVAVSQVPGFASVTVKVCGVGEETASGSSRTVPSSLDLTVIEAGVTVAEGDGAGADVEMTVEISSTRGGLDAAKRSSTLADNARARVLVRPAVVEPVVT